MRIFSLLLISSGGKLIQKSPRPHRLLQSVLIFQKNGARSSPAVSLQQRVPIYFCRNISTSLSTRSRSNRLSRPSEHLSLSNFLNSHPNYKDLVFWEDKTDPEFVEHQDVKILIELANSNPDVPFSDPKFEAEVSKVVAALSELKDMELLQVMHHLRKFPRPHSLREERFVKIRKAIDDECLQRAIKRRNWRSPIHFEMADLWYKLGLASDANFHWQFVKQLLRKVDVLPREEMVRFCFCLSLIQGLPESIKLFDLQHNLNRIADETPRLTSEEIAILCFAFLNLKAPLYDKKLLKTVISLVAEDAQTISSGNLGIIAKTLRLGSHNKLEEAVQEFLDIFSGQIDRLDIQTCTALTKLGTRGVIRSEKWLEAIVRKVQGNLENIHIRGQEEIAFALTLFNIPCQPLLEEMVEVVRKFFLVPESSTGGKRGKHFTRCLPNILNSLACLEIYPQDLISFVYSKEFLNDCYGDRMFLYKPEVITLDQNVLAEVKDYQGNCLPDKPRGYLMKKTMTWVEPPERRSVKPYMNMCREVQKVMVDIFGDSSFVHLGNILPHHLTIEAVFCVNESEELVPVPECYKQKPEYVPKSLTPEDLTLNSSKLEYHAVLIYFWENIVYNTEEPVGPAKMQIRQIEKMGYKTHVVTHYCWKKMLHDNEEQQKLYIERVLGKSFKVPHLVSIPTEDNISNDSDSKEKITVQ